MAATYVAGGSIGSLFPMAFQGVAALDATIALMLPEIMAKLAGALELQARLSIQLPSISASAELAAKIALAINIAIIGPSLIVDFSAVAALIAELQLMLGQLNASLALSIALKVAFGHAGMHLLTVEGPVNQMGNDFQQILQGGLPGGSPGDIGFGAFLVAAADPGSIALIKALIGQPG